jgi:PAS domain S-box-containing protein
MYLDLVGFINNMNRPKTTSDDLNREIEELRLQLAGLEDLEADYKAAKLVLWESQARVASILDIANEAIISIDDAQHIILFNKGAARIFGYSSDEVIGKSLDILLPARVTEHHRQMVVEFGHSQITARLMGERQEIYGCRKNGEEFPAEASISKLEIDGTHIFTVVLRDITERRLIEHEREKRILELRSLNEAGRAISAELSQEEVLQKIAKAARTLVKTRYAALGVHDGQGQLSQFITSGIEPSVQAKIGPYPIGRGLLGVLFYQGKSMIVNDIGAHPTAVGFPEHHPSMGTLLGVPIYSKEELIGGLYLADKEDGSDFTETDRHLVEMLALHAAVAIENSRLYEQTQRLAVFEERERFARDLHDGIIQSIYAVGLTLDQVNVEISAVNETASAQIDLSLKSLASVIQDLRNYIFDLRPQALKYQGLKARLEGLIKELRVNTLLPIDTDIGPDIDEHLSDMQARHVFHISHEALANAARHAKANKILLSLTREEDMVTLLIQDDGIGFEMSPTIKPGHRGLANMKARASEIGARLKIDSAPQQGTSLTITFRCGTPAA